MEVGVGFKSPQSTLLLPAEAVVDGEVLSPKSQLLLLVMPSSQNKVQELLVLLSDGVGKSVKVYRSNISKWRSNRRVRDLRRINLWYWFYTGEFESCFKDSLIIHKPIDLSNGL